VRRDGGRPFQVVNTPRSIKETTITIGLVQVPVSLYKASQETDLNLKSLDECGTPPRQVIVCENPTCGTPLPDPADVDRALKAGEVVRAGPQGAYAAKRFASWFSVPKRGYEWAKGQFVELTKEEIDAAKSEVKYETFEVAKSTDFKAVAMNYVLSDPVYLLPPEDANKPAKESYSLIAAALDQGGSALLAYLTVRDRTYRYAIVADQKANVLMAYQLQERRELPYTPEKYPSDPKKVAQVQAVLGSVQDPDPSIEPVRDAVMELLEQKIAATQKLPGIGQPIIVPK